MIAEKTYKALRLELFSVSLAKSIVVMLQFQLWKKLLVVLVAVLGIIFALPNLIGGDDGTGSKFLPGKQINLGLDLQGGSHLLLRVDVGAVKQERLENLGETLRRDFRSEKIRFSGLAVANETVSLQIRNPDTVAKTKQIFTNLGNEYTVSTDGLTYHLALNDAGRAAMQTRTDEQ